MVVVVDLCVCVCEKETSEDRKVTQRDERGTSHKEERETSRGLMVFRDQVLFKDQLD